MDGWMEVTAFLQYVETENGALTHQSLSLFWIPPIMQGLARESQNTKQQNLLKEGAKKKQKQKHDY